MWQIIKKTKENSKKKINLYLTNKTKFGQRICFSAISFNSFNSEPLIFFFNSLNGYIWFFFVVLIIFVLFLNSENQNNERNKQEQGDSNNQENAGGDDGGDDNNNKKKIQKLLESLKTQKHLTKKEKMWKQQLERMLNIDEAVSVELQQLEMKMKNLPENTSPEEIRMLKQYTEEILKIKKENKAEMGMSIEKNDKAFWPLLLFIIFRILAEIFWW